MEYASPAPELSSRDLLRARFTACRMGLALLAAMYTAAAGADDNSVAPAAGPQVAALPHPGAASPASGK